MIAKRFPDHDIHGEETGGSRLSSRKYQWILDPIDRTAWFSLGVPIFGTLVALLENNEPIIGVIHLPAIRETVYAARGLGCWFFSRGRRPRRIRVSGSVPLGQATILASGAHASDILPAPGRPAVDLRAVARSARKIKFYGDCVQHALVCRRNAHAAIDTVMNPWDIAAVVPCVEDVDGVVATLLGDRKGIIFGGSLVTACSTPFLHEVLGTLGTLPAGQRREGAETGGLREILLYRQAL
jgi:histidinol-phosphatase